MESRVLRKPVGGNKQVVQKYIQNQEKEDMINNQIGLVEYYDPFAQWLESIKKKESKKEIKNKKEEK